MARPRKQDGKRVTLSVKVSERKAAAVDRRRGVLTRAAYLEALIDADLEPAAERERVRRRTVAMMRGEMAPAREVPFSSAERQ